MEDEFDDLQFKIAVDASPAKEGIESVIDSIDKLDESVANVGKGVDFGAAIADSAKLGVSAIEDLDESIQAVMSTAFAPIIIEADTTAAQAELDDLQASIEAASSAGFDIAVDIDSSGVDDSIDDIESMLSQFEGQNVYIPVSIGDESLVEAERVIDNTKISSEEFRREIETPFVITAEDAINAFDSIGQSAIRAEGRIASLNESSGRISQISGINENSIKNLTLKYYDEDASISELLAIEKSLAKQRVENIDVMDELIPKWVEFSKANSEQASSLQSKLSPAWKQFNIDVQDQPQYFDMLTKLFQETGVTSDAFSQIIVRMGPELSKMGLSLQDVSTIFLALNKSGIQGRPALSAFSKALSDINDTAKETKKDVPTGSEAVNAIFESMDIAQPKVESAKKALSDVSGITQKYAEISDRGDTSTEKFGASIDKLTFGLNEMLSPMAPIAAGVAGIGAAGANLLVFDKILLDGKIATGISSIAKELPLLGAAAGGAGTEVAGLGTAIGLLNPLTAVAIVGTAALATAYITNFGGFADNINKAISKAGDAVSDFNAGNYKKAGKEMAEAVSLGFEALGDLLKDVISDLPELTIDAAKLLSGFEKGLEDVMEGAGAGAMIALGKVLNSASIQLDGLWQSIESAWNGLPWNDLPGASVKLLSDGFKSAFSLTSDLFSGIGNILEKGVDWNQVGISAAGFFWNGFKGVNPMIGAFVEGAARQEAGLNTSTTVPSTVSQPKGQPTGTLQYVTKAQAEKVNYSMISVGTVKTDTISSQKPAEVQMTPEFKKWLEERKKSDESASAIKSLSKLFEKESGVKAYIGGETTTPTTGGEESKIPTFKSQEEALAAFNSDIIKAGQEFVIGSEKYKMQMEKTATGAEYELQSQSNSAILQRENAKIAQTNTENAAKQQQAITDSQNKLLDGFKNRLGDAAFKYQQTIKYQADTPDKAKTALTTYQMAIDNVVNDAKNAGISLDGLNTSLQVSGDSINTLKQVYTDTNKSLSDEISKLEEDRRKKLASSKDGKTVDTSAIDQKITDLNNKIKSNNNEIDKLTNTYSKSSSAVKSATAIQTTSIDALRAKYAELSGIGADIIAQLTPEDLKRNIELYGVSLGDVNAELGTSVSQLSSISAITNDIASTQAFQTIQKQFGDLKDQFDSGAITSEEYVKQLRLVSAETDTLSRSTNILKGEQKDAVQTFERNLKEQLRRIEAYGTEEPLLPIGDYISGLTNIKTSGLSQKAGLSSQIQFDIPNITSLTEAYKKQGIEQGRAAALQFQFNDAISDSMVTLHEAAMYADSYNKIIGDTSGVTEQQAKSVMDLMNSYIDAQGLQKSVTDAQAEGGITTEELAGIQSNQVMVSEDLKNISGELPGSLQGVADAIKTLMQVASDAAASAVKSAGVAGSAENQVSVIKFGEQSGGTKQTQKTSQIQINQQNNQSSGIIRRAGDNTSPSGITQYLNFDMSRSVIDKDTSKDLPAQIARQTMIALGRIGI